MSGLSFQSVQETDEPTPFRRRLNIAGGCFYVRLCVCAQNEIEFIGVPRGLEVSQSMTSDVRARSRGRERHASQRQGSRVIGRSSRAPGNFLILLTLFSGNDINPWFNNMDGTFVVSFALESTARYHWVTTCTSGYRTRADGSSRKTKHCRGVLRCSEEGCTFRMRPSSEGRVSTLDENHGVQCQSPVRCRGRLVHDQCDAIFIYTRLPAQGRVTVNLGSLLIEYETELTDGIK